MPSISRPASDHKPAQERDTIEDAYEPYLIQDGFLDRTPRGRQATRLAYEYFGKKRPATAQDKLL